VKNLHATHSEKGLPGRGLGGGRSNMRPKTSKGPKKTSKETTRENPRLVTRSNKTKKRKTKLRGNLEHSRGMQ